MLYLKTYVYQNKKLFKNDQYMIQNNNKMSRDPLFLDVDTSWADTVYNTNLETQAPLRC